MSDDGLFHRLERPTRDSAGSAQWSQARSSFHLLLRLFNETFLSLPVRGCYRLVGLNQTFKHRPEIAKESEYIYEACMIDWSRARVAQDQQISGENASSLFAELASNEGTLNFNGYQQHIAETLHHQSSLITGLLSRLTPQESKDPFGGAQANAPAPFSLEKSATDQFISSQQHYRYYNSSSLVRSTYLSTISLLSLIGVLLNVFIIFIILLSTRQKCHSFLRNSNTGQNHLLLFQLSVAGLILASYILVDNIEIKTNYSSTKFTGEDNNASTSSYFNHKFLDQLHRDRRHTPVDDLAGSLSLSPYTMKGQSSHSLRCNSDDTDADIRVHKNERISMEDKWDQVESYSDNLNNNLAKRYLVVLLTFGQASRLPNGLWYARTSSSSHPSATRVDKDLSSYSTVQVTVAVSTCGHENIANKLSNDIHADEDNDTQDDEDLVSVKFSQTNPADGSNNLEPSQTSFCLLVPMLINLIGSIYVWTVTALAYDRYCAIAHPLQYLRPINTLKSRTYFIALWCMSLLLNLVLPLTFNHLRPQLMSAEIIGKSTGFDSLSSDQLFTGAPSTRFNSNWPDSSEHCQLEDVQSIRAILSTEVEQISSEGEAQWTRIAPTLVQLSGKLVSSSGGSFHNISLMNSEGKQKSRVDSHGHNKQQHGVDQASEDGKIVQRIYTSLLVAHSMFTFTLSVFIPLLIISICNISIYRIVKVHERRLSINSGSIGPVSGNGSSATLHGHSNHRYLSHQYRAALSKQEMVENSDYKSDDESLVSAIWTKLFHGHQLSRPKQPVIASASLPVPVADSPSEGSLDGDGESQSLQRACDSDGQFNQSTDDCSLVNRSKRLIVREDSFQILARLNTHESYHQQSTDSSLLRSKATQSSTELDSSACEASGSESKSNSALQYHRKYRLKRKTSDQRIGFHLKRKDSFNSCSQQFDEKEPTTELEYQSHDEVLISNQPMNDCRPFEGGGIFNQLKLAGLSFAGIAIHELSTGTHQRTLDKSTSCSLGYLMQPVNTSYPPASESRCSIESAPNSYSASSNNGTSPRKSYMIVNLSPKNLGSHIQRCTTKLLEGSLNEEPTSNSHQQLNSNHMCQSHTRFSSFGTKSAIFNVVTWLTLTLLILILPQYIFTTTRQIYSDRPAIVGDESLEYNDILEKLTILLFDGKIESFPTDKWFSILEFSSHWLSCACRILFLCIVPLNGWLYGIRSRSLRISIRMILKRYISRRQASIEITQRQRSISSIRSRELTFNGHWNSQNLDKQLSSRSCPGSQLESGESLTRHHTSDLKFNQSCSKSDSRRKRTHAYREIVIEGSNSSSESHLQSTMTANNETNMGQLDSSGTIRFIIDDMGEDRQNDITLDLHNQSHSNSLVSSMASSSRSLLSNPTFSTHANLSVNKQSLGTRVQNGNHDISHESLADTRQPVDTEPSDVAKDQLRTRSLEPYEGDNLGGASNTCISQATLRRSASELKFLITSTEHEHHVVEFDGKHLLEQKALERQDLLEPHPGVAEPAEDWCRQLKHSLFRLLMNAKHVIGFRPSDVAARTANKRYPHAAGSSYNSRFGSVCSREALAFDEEDLLCRSRLLRTGSLNSHQRAQRQPRGGGGGSVKVRQTELSPKARRKLRNSLSIASLKGIKMDKFCVECRCPADQRKRSCSCAQNRAGSPSAKSELCSSNQTTVAHLKPPTYLKLMLDPDGHTYSSGQALSPIKEYSSNHSYASSQSSLSTSLTNNPVVASAVDTTTRNTH